MGSPASWAGGLSNQSGTATGAAGAETLNAQSGVITTEALSTAVDAVATRTLTNSFITAASIVFVQWNGNTVAATSVSVATGVATIKAMPVGAAFSGAQTYNFFIL